MSAKNCLGRVDEQMTDYQFGNFGDSLSPTTPEHHFDHQNTLANGNYTCRRTRHVTVTLAAAPVSA
jgi:hypothetical protein